MVVPVVTGNAVVPGNVVKSEATVVGSPDVGALGAGVADVDGTPVVVDTSATMGNSYSAISLPEHVACLYYAQTHSTE